MELIESYLNEVGRFLPKEQRDEILLELRDALLGELEAEADIHPGGADAPLLQQRAVLARFGHPLKVASRYQPKKYLIGPALYPAFIQTLKVLVPVVFAIQVVLALSVGYANGWQIGPVSLLSMAFEVLFWVGGTVVLVFLAIEYSGERLNWYDKWQPDTLPSGSLGVIKRSDVITNLISEGFFLLWFNNVVVLSDWVPGEFSVTLAGVWNTYFWYLNIVFGIAFLLHLYVLVRGVWQQKALLAEIAVNVAVLGLIAGLLLSGDLLVFSGALQAEVQVHIERIVKVSLLVVGATCVWDIGLAIKVFRGTLGRLATVTA